MTTYLSQRSFHFLCLALLGVFLGQLMPEAAYADKTLVVWATPENVSQQGGGLLTIEKHDGIFDGIVFGELAAGKWMSASNGHLRSPKNLADFAVEQSSTPVQIAVVYQGEQVSIFRNGKSYATYNVRGKETFGSDSVILFGLRHLGAGDENAFFSGTIDDARIYNIALGREAIAALRPNESSQPAPVAWWNFEEGRTVDEQKWFVSSTLHGEARIADGKLHLKQGGYMVASTKGPKTMALKLSRQAAAPVARALREELLTDPHRPGYHFVIPEGNGMPFDPNGAIFWKGRYHLFYIFQDERGHNWGHVSSTDLFHWRHHPTHLLGGMFSGNCFVNKDGVPTMCYHQVGQGNAMAVALDDELNEWKKLDSNPITPVTREGDEHHGKYRSWDPYGWLEGDTYYAIFGGHRAAVAKSTGTLAGPWKYTGDLLAHTVPGVSIKEDISCADFFQLGNKRMLLCISHRLGARYYLGEWKNEQFHPSFHQQMSWVDNAFFAPESLLDDRGRRIMWAWAKDRGTFKVRDTAGWSGVMSLPRVLSLDEKGQLRQQVPEEITRLRYNHKRLGDVSLAADTEMPLEVQGDSLELAMTFKPGTAGQYGLKVRCSPGGEEETRIYYDAADKKLKIDTRHSSLSEGPKSIEAAPLGLADGESLELRVFLDKSIIEVFAGGRQAVMRRVYPTRADSQQIKLFSSGGTSGVSGMEAWEMMPSNAH